ncbi:5-carboxymethyl-2-hydroxymuconate Delta-isomerase [Hydromonas duriensis]|uniref:5-carboxymethyl-2-hydroxymuconate isomerase n=1 Tax=Hydromonas duriensis TaxID=1527608 RepID=A0A4R6Y924_9BURK|nr:5-carboxymethyl-2-hydroxymuconate isomerase [Hydromonas duriensis]TDR31941.1 5-carboxymethyl-2-hydroxymuconate isomerase [Hydromonas duriensis]
MPHIVIEYAQDIVAECPISTLMEAAHQGAMDSGLFSNAYDIKTRAMAYADYRVGHTQDCFIHICIHLLSGRSDEQKTKLTHSILKRMQHVVTCAQVITVEAMDMNRASYAKYVSAHTL